MFTTLWHLFSSTSSTLTHLISRFIYPCRSDLSFHGRVLPELSEDGFISSQVHHVLLGLFFSWQDHVGSCRKNQVHFDSLWISFWGCELHATNPSIYIFNILRSKVGSPATHEECGAILHPFLPRSHRAVATRDKLIVWNSMAISHFGKCRSFPFP